MSMTKKAKYERLLGHAMRTPAQRFNVGDAVTYYVGSNFNGQRRQVAATVARITPSGQVVLSDGSRFTSSGNPIGNSAVSGILPRR
jgi:hypothetical protein